MRDSSPATTYYYRVEATNDGGTAYGEVRTFATTGGGPLPTGPSGVVSIEPTLDWSDLNGASFYEVQLSTDATFSSPLIGGLTQSQFPVLYDVVPLANATTYYWRVVTTLSLGGAVTSQVASFRTVSAAVPRLYYPASGQAVTPVAVAFTWDVPAAGPLRSGCRWQT